MKFFSILLSPVLQVQWVRWMEYAESVVIAPETNFADIFVPTAETVRTSFLIDMLLTNKKPVSAGPLIHSISQHFHLKLFFSS